MKVLQLSANVEPTTVVAAAAVGIYLIYSNLNVFMAFRQFSLRLG